jgi:hypothetical protein
MDSMYEAAGAMFAINGVADRAPEIRHTPCGELPDDHATGQVRHTARGVLCDLTCVVETSERIQGFSATCTQSQPVPCRNRMVRNSVVHIVSLYLWSAIIRAHDGKSLDNEDVKG